MTAPATVLVTGASAGIGAALAAQFACHGHDLVLVARRVERLEAIAEQLRSGHGVRVEVIGQDLAVPGAASAVHEATGARGLQVGVLVNNAGVAPSAAFKHMAPEALEALLRLNVETLTLLTARYLPAMLAAGYGRILNVASVAGFQPVPSMAAYAASKAYVLSLSEALAEELQGSGVRVSALCPGLTRTDSALVDTGLPAFLVSEADEVARQGYRACMAGEPVCVPGMANQIGTLVSQTQPRWLVRAIGGLLGRQRIRR